MNRVEHAAYSTPEELASSFSSNLREGLDWSECDRRLKVHGLNEFKVDDSSRIVSKYLEQFKNPLIQLLMASILISMLMGQYDDAISISLVSLHSLRFLYNFLSASTNHGLFITGGLDCDYCSLHSRVQI